MIDDIELDRYLNIKTTGRDDSIADLTNFPYEATPYGVLEVLANSGYITKKNYVLDYGSGKGRVDFYLSYQTKCKSLGIEYDKRLFDRAMLNKESAVSKNRVDFILSNAMEFEVPSYIDRIYFFNPFSKDILKIVLDLVHQSIMKNNREILLIFYYISDYYVELLNDYQNIRQIDVIKTNDLFHNEDRRESLSIYEMRVA